MEGANYGLKPLELAQPDKVEKIICNIDSQTRPWWSPKTTINYLSSKISFSSYHHLSSKISFIEL
jgi:hypothetical protein